jgi:hypothetical protein
MRNLAIVAVLLWLCGCGMMMEDLIQFERDCKPKLAEMSAFPGENFSIVKYCKCTVKDHKPAAECEKIANEPLPAP